jgi:hypothetical protein
MLKATKDYLDRPECERLCSLFFSLAADVRASTDQLCRALQAEG